MDRTAFPKSLRSSPLCANIDELRKLTVDQLFNMYDDTLRRIVDDRVPAYTATVRDRRRSPWFDDECRASRRRSRMFERRYRRTLRADDRLAWIRQVREMHSMYVPKESRYWTSCTDANVGNPKKLWRSMFVRSGT